MKRKDKGKVYPSPPSSTSSTSTTPSSALAISSDGDVLSVLSLLPAAILALASILSLEDREVLAYMITRSIKTTTTPQTPSSSFTQDSKKKPTEKLPPNRSHNNTNNHKAPIFYCDCFDCYRSYWFRWDSSPNRELIHQAIEAFEDHLSNGEQSFTTRKSARSKRRAKTGRRVPERQAFEVLGQVEILGLDSAPQPVTLESPPPSPSVLALDFASPNDDVASLTVSPVSSGDGGFKEEGLVMSESSAAEEKETAVVLRTHGAVSNRKGLARKVLPDVLGLLNSRLWNLWSPNV